MENYSQTREILSNLIFLYAILYTLFQIERREKLPVEMKEDEEKKKQQAEEDARKEEQQVMYTSNC